MRGAIAMGWILAAAGLAGCSSDASTDAIEPASAGGQSSAGTSSAGASGAGASHGGGASGAAGHAGIGGGSQGGHGGSAGGGAGGSPSVGAGGAPAAGAGGSPSAGAGGVSAGGGGAGPLGGGGAPGGASGAGGAVGGAAGSGTGGDGGAPSGGAGGQGPNGPGRGFPATAPWASFYGPAGALDLAKVAATFRVINLDADPDAADATPAQIATLKANGQNRVISYMNVGSCESYRSYWSAVPAGFVSCQANVAAQRGPYDGYPDETWMDVGDADYQKLIVEYVAPRLVAQGVDGFFLDNLEIIEHSANDTNGPCDAACRQGGLDLVRKLREAFPQHLIVMQNATSDVSRLGVTGGVPYPSLLDGISHEEVYAPTYDAGSEAELLAWKGLGLLPGGHPFFLGTEDYVGSCSDTTSAKKAYDQSKAQGFSPYESDASAMMTTICLWPFL